MARRFFKRLFLVLVFPLHAAAGEFEERYGIGVVHVEPYNYFSLDFLKNPRDANPFEQVYFFRDSTGSSLHFQFAMTGPDTLPRWFNPEIFSLSCPKKRIDFLCLRKDGNWCNVLVNRETRETKWVELGPDVRFIGWNTFLTGMSSIRIIRGDENLYEKPDTLSEKTGKLLRAENDSLQHVRVKRVEGEWMEVEVTGRNAGQLPGTRTGWIRWRDEKELRIAYGTGC